VERSNKGAHFFFFFLYDVSSVQSIFYGEDCSIFALLIYDHDLVPPVRVLPALRENECDSLRLALERLLASGRRSCSSLPSVARQSLFFHVRLPPFVNWLIGLSFLLL